MIKEWLIILLLLTVLLGVICLLYATGILRRRVVVTIVENLPIGIFKENNVQVREETVETHIQEIKNSCIQDEEIVYWTPHGKHYHKIHNCRTLLRSKVINSGSIDESGKLTGCNKCN